MPSIVIQSPTAEEVPILVIVIVAVCPGEATLIQPEVIKLVQFTFEYLYSIPLFEVPAT
jgi:hypothetical protein